MSTKISHSLHPNRVSHPGAGDLGSPAAETPTAVRSRARNRKATSATAPPEPGSADGELHSITLACVNPLAQEVHVAGTFNGWDPRATPMTRHEDGSWAARLLLPPGRHEYRFIVDGQWQEDPAARQSVDNPFGGRNSILEVAAVHP